MNSQSKPKLDKDWVKKALEERGIPIAPPDHWIYSEGATITFVPTKPLRKKRKGAGSSSSQVDRKELP